MGLMTDFLLIGVLLGFSFGFSLRDLLQSFLNSRNKPSLLEHNDEGGD